MPASAHYRINEMTIPELQEYIRSCHAKIGEATVREYHTGKFRLDQYSGAEADAHFEKYVGRIGQARAALQRAHGARKPHSGREPEEREI